MHEKVKAYLEEQRQKTLEARGRKLVELGLWETEFDPEERGYSSQYPNLEDGRYYRKAPVEVTEEEWADICRCAGEVEPMGGRRHSWVSVTLCVIAVFVCIAGFLLGLLVYGDLIHNGQPDALAEAISVWGWALAIGTGSLGFSEIIRLLDR